MGQPPAGARRILLADCDQMFVAVARLADPEVAGKARLLVVGGRPGGRGVVCSASYEARAYGLRAGMPISRAERLCPKATFVPVPRKACGVKHREIRAVLDEWTPLVEPASVDEFYLDLTGTERLYKDEALAQTAGRLRADVHARAGLTLSIGGGTNRLVAKLAAERAKPRNNPEAPGVLIVPPGQEGAFLADHALAEIPGVGPRLQAALRRYGLIRVPEALRIECGAFERWLGPRTGQWLYRRIRGQGSDEVDPVGEAKSMSHEETFAKDIASDDALEAELLRLVTALGRDLRAEGLAAGCITVKLRDHDFKTRQLSRSQPEPLRTDRAIFGAAREMLRALRARRRVAARLVGVSFSALTASEGKPQFTLLPADTRERETPKDRRLATAVDRINAKLGERTIRPARLVRRPGRERE
ncbi:MAG: DNA polymerase IV [Gemmatimonadales bacterium]|nr:DNA polymerase IV [Gemmatimonadales bacterium]